jgi:hypothetical protein
MNKLWHKFALGRAAWLFQGGLIVSLKTLLGIAYWRDPRTWQGLEYDGPVTAKWGIRRLGNMPLPRDDDEKKFDL